MPEDIETLKARIAELEARLEIDHAYRMDGDGDEMVRVEILLEDRASFPDGITARDATIKLQDEALARKDATIASLEQKLAQAVLRGEELKSALESIQPSSATRTDQPDGEDA